MRKSYKIYGFDGHRIKESFKESYTLDLSNYRNYPCVISVLCKDKTGTNDFCIVEVETDTEEHCFNEFYGQVSDGIFENQKTGYWEEI